MNFLRLYSRFSLKQIPVRFTTQSTFCLHKSFEPDDNRDKLMLNIRNAQHTDNLFSEVSMHSKIMGRDHLLQAFQTLFRLHKTKKTRFSVKEITQTNQFEQLVNNLGKVLRTLESHEIVNLLKIAIYFEMNSDSRLIECLLQMVRHTVNSLSMHDAIFLSFIMKKLTKSPLVEALQIAMPMLVEMRLQTELDVNNADDLIKLFVFVTNEKLSNKSLNFVCEHLTEIPVHTDYKKVMNIYWSLTHYTNNNPTLEPLVNSTMNYFRNGWKSMQPDDIFVLFRRMCKMRSNKQYQFFDADLISDLVDYLLDNLRIDYKNEMLESITYYTRLSNIEHDNLAGFIIECLDGNKMNLNAMTVSSLTNCFDIVSSSSLDGDRVSGFLRKYLPEIFQLDSQDSTKKLLWIKLFLICAYHGIYERKILEIIFDNETIQSAVLNTKDGYYAAVYQMANRLVLDNCPENVDLLPSNEMVERLSKILNRDIEYNTDVRNYLEMAFGGESYIASNVQNDFGFNIDFLVQMRQDGYPVAFESKNIRHLKDINVSSGTCLVAVIVLSDHCYLSNRLKLKHCFKLYFDVLERNDIAAVSIAQKEWTNITNREKIPYLMQAIRLKMKDRSERAQEASN